MARHITLAIDAMGGDHAPKAPLHGAAAILEEFPDIQFLIFGDENKIGFLLKDLPDLKARAKIIHTEKAIQDHDKPSSALRNGKGSSMRMAIEAVEKGAADAVVSGGNTGALMAMAKMILKMVPGLHRPAIASQFPTLNGMTVMLDLGANVLVDAENLVQFAVLGSVFAKTQSGMERPSVGLLNVGSEESKGPDHVRMAGSVLSSVQFPGVYKGFVEGNDIPMGTVDVVVSDGYAGNIALKTAEGMGKLSGQYFKNALNAGILARIGSLFAAPSLSRLKKQIDPRHYNGGVFLGLNGICVKSHGGSDEIGFASALRMAVHMAEKGYIKTIAADISKLMSQEDFLADTE